MLSASEADWNVPSRDCPRTCLSTGLARVEERCRGRRGWWCGLGGRHGVGERRGPLRAAGLARAAVQAGQAQLLPCVVDGGEEGVGEMVERQVSACAAMVGRVEDVLEGEREVVVV